MSVVLDVLENCIDPLGYINLSMQQALCIMIKHMENIHVPHSEVRGRQLQQTTETSVAQIPDINIDEIEFMLHHIYDGAKTPWLSVASRIVGLLSLKHIWAI